MKSLEVKRIGAGSVFRFYFAVGVILGLISCIIVLAMGASLQNLGINLGSFGIGGGGALQIGAAIIGLIIGSLAYGIFLGIAGAIGAFLYNVFAAAVGGIVIKVKE